MHFRAVTIFPEIFTSFASTSLINKAIENKKIKLSCINPRDFCTDKHKQVDDEIYGGWPWLLIKAQPIIDSINAIIAQLGDESFTIIFVQPSQIQFTQQHAHESLEVDNLIFISGRYEWIDERAYLWASEHYPSQTSKRSLGSFITLGWETPTMVMIESIARLVPTVLHDYDSTVDESYNIQSNMSTIEYPQYTRPEIIEWMGIPETLLSGHHVKIQEWKDKQTTSLKQNF